MVTWFEKESEATVEKTSKRIINHIVEGKLNLNVKLKSTNYRRKWLFKQSFCLFDI